MLSACASLRQSSEIGTNADANHQQQALANASPAHQTKPQAQPTVRPQIEDPLPKVKLSKDLLYDILRAEIAFQRGQWQIAYVILLRDAQQTRDPRLSKRAAEIALAAQRPNETLAAVRLWTELAPHSDEALQNYIGLIMLGDNISELAPLLMQRLAAAEPQTRGPMILQIQRLLSRARDQAAAFTILQDIVAPYPTLLESHLALAQGAYANRDASRARQEAQLALQRQADSELAILTLAQVTPNPNDAIQLIADFLQQYPDTREVRIAYARALVEQKHYEQARAQFQILLQQAPDDLTSLFALGILDVQTNRLAQADIKLQHYLEVLAAHPEDKRDPTAALLLLSQIAEEGDDIPAALKWLEQVKPGAAYVSAQIRRSQLLAKRGDINGARQILQQTQADANKNREQQQLIQAEAQILRDAERYQEAADVLTAGLKLLPDSTDLLYDYAMTCDKLGHYQAMETALRKIIATAPNSQHAYNALGYSLADRNIRLPEALKLIQKAISLAPQDPFIADSLGWAEFRLGNLLEAERQLRRAYGLRPDPEIAVHLGEILWARGNQDEAKQLWREAQSKAPQNEVLNSTLHRLNVHL